jgi:hypothetical protein
MTIEERLDALTMNLELEARNIQDLLAASNKLVKASEQDGQNIRALARIAEIHERRLTALEGPAEG